MTPEDKVREMLDEKTFEMFKTMMDINMTAIDYSLKKGMDMDQIISALCSVFSTTMLNVLDSPELVANLFDDCANMIRSNLEVPDDQQIH